MKKILKLISLFTIVLYTSCGVGYNPKNSEHLESFSYCKDTVSNLCFATTKSISSDFLWISSITCIPCDSIKKATTKNNIELLPKYVRENLAYFKDESTGLYYVSYILAYNYGYNHTFFVNIPKELISDTSLFTPLK